MLNVKHDAVFLERLYTENYALVYKMVLRILRQYASTTNDASDIVQDVFVLAAKRIDVLRTHPNPVGWLIKTAQYVCRNYVSAYSRGHEQLFETLDLHAGPEKDMAKIDTLISLEQMLTPEEFALLKAYYIDQRSTEEICRETGFSPNRLRVRMHRLKKYLSAYFVFLVIFASCNNI
ncbi:MAG: sigma-70 family RNA polymerase sigma factor [Clostridia bacterium]|nr:sigma-70 family RNA polymerase sigma factor [Clostridia bacterium]